MNTNEIQQQQPAAEQPPRVLVECPRCKGRALIEAGVSVSCSSASHRQLVLMRPVPTGIRK